jgi:N-acyl-D-amino-acid deacylase
MRTALALIFAGIGLVVAPQPGLDVLITNARILDGTGNPWLRGDIGIRGDRIAAVGRLTGTPATLVIDAADRVVTPGFIDVHSHALESITRGELRDARPLIAQGVTTVVGNPDGGGPVDLARQRAGIEAEGGVGVNVALLIGHGSVRSAIMGPAQRAPSADELVRMKTLIKQGVADGAFGLSSGLFYTPGRYAKTEEVIALAREAGGVDSHRR